jgi:hypothetical protein
MESQPGNESMSIPLMVAMIVSLMAMYYVVHRIAHTIVTEYGLRLLHRLRRNLRY